MKKMRKLMSLLLALSVVLGCSVNAFAALPEEEEVAEPQVLTPIYLLTPPYGSSGDYDDVVISYNGSVEADFDLLSDIVTYGAMSYAFLNTYLGISAFDSDDLELEFFDYALTFAVDILAYARNYGIDPDSGNMELYYTHTRSKCAHPDAVQITRKYYPNSSRNPNELIRTVTYYIWYV